MGLDGVPKDVTVECVFGRDGVNETDWTYSVDNANCEKVMKQEIIDFYFEGFVAGATNDHSPKLALSSTGNTGNAMTLSVIAVVVVGTLLMLWRMVSMTNNGKLSSSEEIAPLLVSA